jgi:alpha-L-arabinofuranosidase
MPCACQIPVPNYPGTADWGPILWKILHGLAEKAGHGIMLADEVREWQKFFRLTGEMIPCDVCKAHYQQYLKQHPSAVLAGYSVTQINTWVKSWYWNLHNNVNLSKSLPIFPYVDLETTYASVDFTDQLYRLTPVIKNAIQMSGVPFLKWTAWVSSFKMMRSILAV